MYSKPLAVIASITGLLLIYILTFQLEAVARVSIALILPIACIWYSEELGHITGTSFPPITQTSPGLVVAIAGWFLFIVILATATITAIVV